MSAVEPTSARELRMTHVALVTTLLGRTEPFRSLVEADRQAIASQMRGAVYGPGQLIFGRGDPAAEMHLVIEGRVRLSLLSAEGRILSFSHANRGDIFGEIAALDGQSRSADAVALTDVKTMMLARTSFWRLMETRPQLAQAAIHFVCHRLRATSDQVEGIALHSAEIRLARFLLAAITLKQGEAVSPHPVVLDLGISQTELGLLLGASRSKVNEGLAELEKRGAVQRADGRLHCNVGTLQSIVRGE